MRKCEYCGSYVPDNRNKCEACGAWCVDSEKPENADAAKSASVADKINAAADKIKLSNGAVHAITVFILCLLLGYFGIHRFIQGKIFTGFVWLFTGGLFFLGYIVDVALSASRMAAELRKNNNG